LPFQPAISLVIYSAVCPRSAYRAKRKIDYFAHAIPDNYPVHGAQEQAAYKTCTHYEQQAYHLNMRYHYPHGGMYEGGTLPVNDTHPCSILSSEPSIIITTTQRRCLTKARGMGTSRYSRSAAFSVQPLWRRERSSPYKPDTCAPVSAQTYVPTGAHDAI
jgi:hypothetical protein